MTCKPDGSHFARHERQRDGKRERERRWFKGKREERWNSLSVSRQRIQEAEESFMREGKEHQEVREEKTLAASLMSRDLLFHRLGMKRRSPWMLVADYDFWSSGVSLHIARHHHGGYLYDEISSSRAQPSSKHDQASGSGLSRFPLGLICVCKCIWTFTEWNPLLLEILPLPSPFHFHRWLQRNQRE